MKVVLRTTGICLALLIGFHLVHIFDTARWMSQDPLPYFVHASVQLLIEMSVFTSVGWWLQRRGFILFGALWLTATIWWSLLHILDIHMVRLMDISLVHATKSVFE